MLISAIPTVDEVVAIAALRDPVIRNLQITRCYHALARAMSARLGGQANWCVFATWASRQAGQSIRGEDLQRGLARVIDDAAARLRGPGPGESPGERSLLLALYAAAVIERTSAAVAEGNRKVFAEIGWEFARYLAGPYGDAAPDAASIDAFCAGLREGDPPDGQAYLRQAFAHYQRSLFAETDKQRSELIYQANIEIGFHEQTRLQPEIMAALDAPSMLPAPGTRDLLDSLDTARANLRARIRTALTAHLMTLWIPTGTLLRLSEDVPGSFPADLDHIDDAALRALLTRVDPTPDSPRDSGAADWGDLADRLHFIVDFFRRYQQAPEMWTPPFTASQITDLDLDRIPSGAL
jgi:hypothetical protein